MSDDDIFVFDEHDPGGKAIFALPLDIFSHAEFSPCKKYRYELRRWWHDTKPPNSIMFLMMNPSTATEVVDDPTVRKCRMYAERWGYNHLIITNIMAYRATNPKELLNIDDPVGPENFNRIRRLIDSYKPFLVCAWGGNLPSKLLHVEEKIMELIEPFKPHVLRLSKSGRPYHPLYLPNDTVPIDWNY